MTTTVQAYWMSCNLQEKEGQHNYVAKVDVKVWSATTDVH